LKTLIKKSKPKRGLGGDYQLTTGNEMRQNAHAAKGYRNICQLIDAGVT
jgi:hypothetical protein